ncbi:metalloregulator ArsR/SmtB family transcription factor [Nocardioides lentus]|uniref:Metalloregulator ArsR/SmtB family transcription factor n=1 Tax=Nocardioides lentus TaxID=338077 RepID=A0ABP5A9Q5_9ACTN
MDTPATAPDTCRTADLDASPLPDEEARELSRLLKAVADPVRLQLVALIAAHEDAEACVCDLTCAFDLSAPTISHHLKVLREAGVLVSERRGTWVHYRLCTDALGEVARALAAVGTPRVPLLVSAASR